MDKYKVRHYLKEQRARMTYKKRLEKSQKIMEKLITQLDGKNNIAFYINTKDEVITHDFLPYFLENYETVSTSVTEEEIEFFAFTNIKQLKEGYVGILEPPHTNKVEKADIDVIIVPMLGFDKYCNRIGYGKGFYDKYLEDFNGEIIGLAFSEQQYPLIPTDKYDVKMHKVITDREVIIKPKL